MYTLLIIEVGVIGRIRTYKALSKTLPKPERVSQQAGGIPYSTHDHNIILTQCM
jgi:hypothetical protein